jgi:preprotein translocase subunit YajC
MDPISLFMIAVLGLLIFFMIRNSRKQRATQQELQEKLKPGAHVMTSFGLYATVVELDDDTNIATLDVGTGSLKVHRQTLTKVIEDDSPEAKVLKAAKPAAKKPAVAKAATKAPAKSAGTKAKQA